MAEKAGAARTGLTRRGGLGRLLAFGLLTLACLSATVAYAVFRIGGLGATALPGAPQAADRDALESILTQPHLIFVDLSNPLRGRLGFAPLISTDTGRLGTSMPCDRAYFSNGRGLCLGAQEHYYGNRGVIDFDAQLQPVHAYANADGVCSRARVAPDGRMGSVTVFVAGDSYGAPFSTRDHLFDLSTGADQGTLEEFIVYKDGALFQSPSFNFWGTTFARDGQHFFATLADGSVGSTTYLVQGDLVTREMRVLRTNVECPSLSPDETRLAFKERIQAPNEWRLAVLDLATLQEMLVNESRSVDDQVEWLDDTHILYAMPRQATGTELGTDIWEASTRGDETPRIYLTDAASPSVVR
ncbi:MAG TPA: hypothetical protein VGJ60_19230 [Chloroflexota bacterium]